MQSKNKLFEQANQFELPSTLRSPSIYSLVAEDACKVKGYEEMTAMFAMQKEDERCEAETRHYNTLARRQ